MGWESFGVFGFDLGLLLQSPARIAKPKSAHNSFIIKRPTRDTRLHMGGILAEGSSVSAGSASLPTYSVFTSGWNFFKLGTYI